MSRTKVPDSRSILRRPAAIYGDDAKPFEASSKPWTVPTIGT